MEKLPVVEKTLPPKFSTTRSVVCIWQGRVTIGSNGLHYKWTTNHSKRQLGNQLSITAAIGYETFGLNQLASIPSQHALLNES